MGIQAHAVRDREAEMGTFVTTDTTIDRALPTPADAHSDAQCWTIRDMATATVLVIGATLIAGLIAVVVADPLLDAGQSFEDDATAYAITLIPSMILVEVFLLASAIWFGPRKYRLSLATLGVRPSLHASWWLPEAMAIASLALVYGYDAVMSWASVEPASTPDEVFENVGPFIVVALGAVLMAPWIEEIFFRGFLFGGLRERWGWILAAVVSGFLFATAHVDPYGMPVYFGIGILFAWAYHYTGSIRSSIIAHVIVNACTVGVALATSGSI